MMQKFLALYPLPNSGLAKFSANNYVLNPKFFNDTDQGDVWLDHCFSDKDSFFARYSRSDNRSQAPLTIPGVPYGGYFVDLHFPPHVLRGQNGGLAETHIQNRFLTLRSRLGRVAIAFRISRILPSRDREEAVLLKQN